jgi:DNA transformation protein and related proteins
VARQKSPIERPRRKPATEFGRRVRVSEGFRTFALDQLSRTARVFARNMFGGVGLYAGDVFFGILAGDVLYLKCDDRTRDRFLRAGARPFTPYANRPGSTKYFEVPLAVLEDADELGRWVADAVVAAGGARSRKR